MGYDVTVRFEGREAYDDMSTFLEDHGDIIRAICQASGEQHDPHFYAARSLGYSPPHEFGLGMHCTVVTRAVIGLVAWVACKSQSLQEGAQPVMWIDDMPAAINVAINEAGRLPGAGITVDERGILVDRPTNWQSRLGDRLLGVNRAKIRELLGELNDAWLTRAEPKAKHALRR